MGFHSKSSLRRLDLEFSLSMMGIIAVMLFGILFGAMVLLSQERAAGEKIERAYMETKLEALKGKLVEGVVLKHRKSIDFAISRERAALNLNRLTLTTKDGTVDSVIDREVDSLIGGEIPLFHAHERVGTLSYESGSRVKSSTAKVFLFASLMFIIFLLVVSVYISQYLQTRFFFPIASLIEMSGSDTALDDLEHFTPTSHDVSVLRRKFMHLIQDQIEKRHVIAQLERKRSVSELASQVAHDIRSPLMALNMLATQLDTLPEETRVLTRSAIARVHDIANNLLSTFRNDQAESDSARVQVQLLSGLVDSIVSEKRLKVSKGAQIEIETKCGVGAYALFASVAPREFQRILSNLLDNAIESYEGGRGKVSLLVALQGDSAVVEIEDKGCGISPDTLRLLGTEPLTSSKSGGHGLGVFHARKTIESWGGALQIVSEIGKGACVTILLPREKEPDWFLPRLKINPGESVVVLDDDQAIHQTWDRLLAPYTKRGLRIVHFRSTQQFLQWRSLNKRLAFVGLFDHELIGSPCTGLDIIEKYRLAHGAILVTSHSEDPEIVRRCERGGIKMLPKALATALPIDYDPGCENSDSCAKG